ncbi:nucleoside recognition domain-containing protein [Gorillibacterium sp. CAU 1737]|uniref:nucleoside recognition domain-containing protein n=1 Tax=Gorillibacterium sp. CAU 1737 TaxID=3140362 RepID=UPI00326172E0
MENLNHHRQKESSNHAWILPAILLAVLIGLLLAEPTKSLQAAVRGTAIWWDVLFPALFPFFLVSEVMLGFGLVHFFGTLLDPLMRPLFRIPGSGGFVMAMGFASGYPVSARLTSRLMEQKLLTREEGERLVAFTTTSDPIFLIGAVSVGFFGNARVAMLLAAAHYGSALLVGGLMRFHGRQAEPSPTAARSSGKRRPLLVRSFTAMHEARLLDGRPFGQLFREAIASSLKLIFVVGGLVVFFAVLLEALRTSGLLAFLQRGLGELLSLVGLPGTLADALVGGLFEVTLGTNAAADAGGAALLPRLAAAAFVLSWAGLSVHAQVVSLLTASRLRYLPFAAARLVHGILAALLVFPLARWLLPSGGDEASGFVSSLPAFLQGDPLSTAGWLSRYAAFPVSLLVLFAILSGLFLLIVLQWFLNRLYNRQK